MFKDLRLRPSSQMGASTGIDALTGDPAAVRRCQKRSYVRDIPRLTPSSEDRITGSELERGRILKHGSIHVGSNESGLDRIDRNSAGTQLARQREGQRINSPFVIVYAGILGKEIRVTAEDKLIMRPSSRRRGRAC